MSETLYAEHVNPAFVRLLGVFGYGRVFVRAQGVQMWDREGRVYLDALAGFGSVNVGHNHPRLLARLKALLDESPLHFAHTGPSPQAAELAARLAGWSGLDVSLFASSGAEAVDAALKLARAATGREAILYCDGAFHGLTLGALSVLGSSRLRRPFEPLVPHCSAVPFGDLGALERALAKTHAAAFIVEPVQAEGGVRVPPPGYLAEVGRLCRRAGTVFILDEIQTGLGRTGTRFAFEGEGEGAVPDALLLAKSLGGGIAPISAVVTRRALHAKAYGRTDRFDLHGSTFAGNALSCVAALETLAIVEDEGLCGNAAARGDELCRGLQERLRGHPLVREVRGRGLLVGIELGPTEAGWLNRAAPFLVRGVARSLLGHWVSLRLLERGIVAQPASQEWNVLRLEPPLTVTSADVRTIVEAVGGVLDDYRQIPAVVAAVGSRLREQRRRRWAFR